MSITNSEIASLFRKLADLLDIEGANPFRIRAYRQAALVIDTFPRSIADMVANGEDLSQLPGIGKDLAGKIQTIVKTGDFPTLDEVMERTPPVLTDLLQIPGLGPRKVELLYESLGVETLADLETALRNGRVAGLPGFGPKTVSNLLAELEKLRLKGPEKRLPIVEADPIAASLIRYLSAFEGVIKVQMAGSFRRRKETVGDLDIVAAARNGPGMIRYFCAFPDVRQVELRGVTRGTIILKSGLHVDLRVVGEKSYGTTLAYFTGARSHTISIRKLAVKNGWKLNEYGLFDAAGKSLAGADEQGLYKAFGMAWIPPELREMHGEMEAARSKNLPDLLPENAIKGDLRVASSVASLSELANRAGALGYEWIGIADPFPSDRSGRKKLQTRNDRIDRFNAGGAAVHFFKTATIEIPLNGGLPDDSDLLTQLDYLCCYPANHAGSEGADPTESLIRTMDQAKALDLPVILLQLTGRQINAQGRLHVNLDAMAEHAAKLGHAIEICEQPDQLGVSDTQCQRLLQKGARLALASGAMSPTDLSMMKYAVWQARRGWAESRNVANCRHWKEVFR